VRPIRIEVAGGRLAATHHRQICALYDSVFSIAPFAWSDGDSSEHDTLLRELSHRDDFTIAVAAAGTELVGFAYGHTLPVDHGWWQGIQIPLASDVVSEWPGRTFALIDFAVAESWRGQGIGATLLRDLLASRHEERAVLSVQKTAEVTRRIYRHLGWHVAGVKQFTGPDGVESHQWVIMLRSLR
jgi:ribosomal protein S18 acetylase RimI-like enzyme